MSTEMTPEIRSTEPRPLRADARRNRERVLKAAHKAFADSGRDVQMDEVAALAGVGVGTLYRHFPTKEDLVLELVREVVRANVARTRQALTRGDAWEAIESLVRENAADMAGNRGLCHAMSVMQFGDENPWRSDEVATCNHELLERARSEGAIAADITGDDWRGLMCGLSASIANGADPDRQVDFVLAALRPR